MRILLPLALLVACGGTHATTPVGSGSQPTRTPATPPPAATEGTPAAEPTAVETAPAGAVTVQGATGPIVITPVYHATMMLQAGGRTVWFDPWSKGALDGKPKADVIVLTDIHFDHTDPEAIAKVAQDGTLFVGPEAVGEKLEGRSLDTVVGNGETVEVAGMELTAVPMYNLVRGPEEGGVFHEKGRGNGYIVKVDGKRIYIAGDTECTDEMKALTDIDLAFVPMNLPYTMPPEEAAACVKAFAPTRVVPFHYAGSDRAVFAKALEGSGVKVELAEFYPGGEPW